MYKNIIQFLFIFLILNTNFLFSSNKKLNCINNELIQSNWKSLYLNETDLKAAKIAQIKLKGGHYDRKLHAVIPRDMKQTEKEWKKAKDHIAQIIGPIPNPPDQERMIAWENSAKSVDELLHDARSLSLSFKNDFRYIALVTHSVAYFGPKDQNIMKSRESLINKVKRDAQALNISEKEAIAKIGDVLRGTIIVDDLIHLPAVIAEIISYADFKDAQINFKNIWMENRESGYVGIHAKMLIPLFLYQTEQHNFLVEIQIHFRPIVDGTEESVKERAHLIYERSRLENFHHLKLSAASKLLFLTAMEEIIHSLQKK